ncbi:MAG: alkaline phosphatase family protein [Rhodocyclaceae bacterium]|uniref:alkaline phosphatase family protein n=1 Tax=Sulfuricystis thermophila TaxID=2496847 RepID=UPI001036353A|nr:alkaline phosphatase family protein [Sulfuricystis thermophila]MDI6750351.1 alkaline phosphatase family protein [Rhodocyclaceae bacterium]
MKRLFAWGLSFVLPSMAAAADTLLIVSIDALHPAALSVDNSPTLQALMQPGYYTLQGRSVEPPKTLVAHTAMMTGLPPVQNGKIDNQWRPGDPQVDKPTLFDDGRRLGYQTAYYYSKPKLGYLVNPAVGEHALDPDGGIERVRAFFRHTGKRFAFLHVSGLEWVGTDSGWLSQAYLDELKDIDAALAPLFHEVSRRGKYAIVVISDHAGHDKLHGTNHPEDYKLPLIVSGNLAQLPKLPAAEWSLTELRSLFRELAR